MRYFYYCQAVGQQALSHANLILIHSLQRMTHAAHLHLYRCLSSGKQLLIFLLSYIFVKLRFRKYQLILLSSTGATMVGANSPTTAAAAAVFVVGSPRTNLLREYVIKDLALWPQVLSDKQRIFLIERGPVQVKESSYPSNSAKRSISNVY